MHQKDWRRVCITLALAGCAADQLEDPLDEIADDAQHDARPAITGGPSENVGAPASIGGTLAAPSEQGNEEDPLVDKVLQYCTTDFISNPFTIISWCDANYRFPDHAIMVKEDPNYGSWYLRGRETAYIDGVGFEMCPEGSFIYSYEMKHAPYAGTGWSSGNDDTGMNGIHFPCWTKTGLPKGTIGARESPWGNWMGITTPPGSAYNLGNPLVGMEMKWLAAQGSNDDVGAVRVQGRFLSGHVIPSAFYTEADWGSWQGMKVCPAGMAVCGVDTQTYANVGSADDLGMTGLRLACCFF